MSVAPPLGNSWSKRSPTFKPSSTSLLLISSGLTWGSNTTSLFLISPGPPKVSNFFVRVQLTSLLLTLPGPPKVSNFFVRVQLTSLLLTLPGPPKVSNFFVRVQLTSLLLILPGLCYLFFFLLKKGLCAAPSHCGKWHLQNAVLVQVSSVQWHAKPKMCVGVPRLL